MLRSLKGCGDFDNVFACLHDYFLCRLVVVLLVLDSTGERRRKNDGKS
jgi:hypothetical protein